MIILAVNIEDVECWRGWEEMGHPPTICSTPPPQAPRGAPAAMAPLSPRSEKIGNFLIKTQRASSQAGLLVNNSSSTFSSSAADSY